MGKKVYIVPLLEDGELIYPPTITPAVIDPKTGMTLDDILKSGITPDMRGVVSVFPQVFTDEEKWQARKNINAMPADTPIPSQVTEEVVSSWGFTKNTGDYSKPVSGIPVSDLSLEVRELLRKANSALQSESDPTVPSWAKQSSKPSYTASEVGAVPTTRKINGKALSSDVTLDASDVGALPSSTPIPTVPTKVSAFTNDAGYLTSHQDITGKEDKVDIVSASGQTLTAEVGKYYTPGTGDFILGPDKT